MTWRVTLHAQKGSAEKISANVLKSRVIWVTFFFNLSRNIVALQFETHCRTITTYVTNLSRSKMHCCKLRQHVAQSRLELYFLSVNYSKIEYYL